MPFLGAFSLKITSAEAGAEKPRIRYGVWIVKKTCGRTDGWPSEADSSSRTRSVRQGSDSESSAARTDVAQPDREEEEGGCAHLDTRMGEGRELL